jgi:inhibitor of KinA sporulation pathway (predicted exonuclease)
MFHQLPYPFDEQHVNLKKLFGYYRGGKAMGVHRALKALGMKFEGAPHRGLDDARNIARIYRRMHADGYWIDDSRPAILDVR